MIELFCYRCGWRREMPDDGRVFLHAVRHIMCTCRKTPVGTWTPADYRARVVDELPHIELNGEQWIEARRLHKTPDAEHARARKSRD